MNFVLIAVGIIFLISIIIGLYRGAVRIAVSLLTTLLTIVIVSIATPYVTKAIQKYTPLDEAIQQKVTSTVTELAVEQIFGEDAEESEESEEMEDAVETMEIPRDVQQQTISAAELPDLYKKLLTSNNNDEGYKELGAKTFAEYVGSYLAKLIIHLAAYVVTFLIVTILLRALVFALDIISNLPMLGVLNHLAGGAIGAVIALILVWVLFIAITLLYTTEIGKPIYNSVQNNDFLKLLYDANPVMQLAMKYF